MDKKEKIKEWSNKTAKAWEKIIEDPDAMQRIYRNFYLKTLYGLMEFKRLERERRTEEAYTKLYYNFTHKEG